MEKLLVTIVLGWISVAAALGQGAIIFNNNANTLVTTNDGFNSGIATNAKVILLYSTAVTPPEAPYMGNGFSLGGWTQTTPATADTVGIVPGRFAGGIQVADDSPSGSTVWAVVIGWTGTYATLEEASQAFANGDRVLFGSTGAWAQPTGNPPLTLESMVLGPNGFNGLVIGVPEPSAIALGILGAFSLFLFQRRK